MKMDKSKYDADGRLKNGINDIARTGSLMQTGSFDDEKKVGIWKRYHPNGAPYDRG
jgi:antitoxin component YwqK of YwqJK toxin-antitoxin module